MKKLSTIFTILAIIAVFGLLALNKGKGVFVAPSPSPSPVVQIEYTTPSPNVTYSFTADTNGQTAFELLKNKATIEYDTNKSGIFVTSINAKKADAQHHWAFYLNGQYAHQGVDKTVLKNGDEIVFTYEEIKPQ